MVQRRPAVVCPDCERPIAVGQPDCLWCGAPEVEPRETEADR